MTVREPLSPVLPGQSGFAAMLFSNPDPILICNVAGTIISANEQLCQIFGYGESELVGLTVDALLPQGLRAAHGGLRDAFVASPGIRGMAISKEVPGVRRDGSEVWLAIRLRLIQDVNGPIIAASVRDVSVARMGDVVRKRSNRILRMLATGKSSTEVLEQLVLDTENSLKNASCMVLRWSEREQRLRVLSAPNLDEKFCHGFEKMPEIVNSPLPISMLLSQRLTVSDARSIAGESGLAKLMAKHALVSCWTNPVLDAVGSRLGVVAVFSRQPYCPDVRDLEFVSAATDLAAIVIERDVRNAQLRDKDEQLRQSQKLEAVGTLVGGVSHEFNNLLQVILGYSQFALDGAKHLDAMRADLERVVAAAKQASTLTQQLLNFSRTGQLELSAVDASETVVQIGQMLSRILKANIELNIECDGEAKFIMADKTQLQQVFLNLSLNAQDAMPEGGKIAISICTVGLKHCDADRLGMSDVGEAVVVSVKDTGIGIPPAECSRIFEPFFTTKEIGRGTGMGLSVVYSIVRDHCGAIDVESECGKGTTFRLYFPSVRGSASPQRPPKDRPLRPGAADPFVPTGFDEAGEKARPL